ncbi:MAG: T9SS type A sorting domain-containing protein [Bacteroidia bacterium]|nr:T9SS type A sorting domain-containing protein [Bacteroidia bacterium]
MKIKLLALVLVAGIFATQAQTANFSYTGTMQTWVVPANVYSVTIDVRGAQGGSATNLNQMPTVGNGGLGGQVLATIAVNPGDILNIFVGGTGDSDGLTLSCFNAAGGYNGGGTGKGGYNSYNYNAGGGGGASDIRLNGSALADRIFVAGGGGGGCCSGCTGAGTDGGAGGGLNGGDGQNSSCCVNQNNGKGGTQSIGGAPGAWCGSCTNATSGLLGTGGRGQDSASCSGGVTCGSGGGGGGGYYGGGGGGNGPGGGGSNYASPNATAVTHNQGVNTGNGSVTITYSVSTGIQPFTSADGTAGIYPNPFSNTLTVQHGQYGYPVVISVLNMLGEEVYKTSSGAAQTEMDLTSLPAGIYQVKIHFRDHSEVRKVVKR